MAATGVPPTTVWHQARRGFMAEGVGGLLRDRTRPPGKAPVPIFRGMRAQVAAIVAMTLKVAAV